MTFADLSKQVFDLEQQVEALGGIARSAWDRSRALEAMVLAWALSQGTSRQDEVQADKQLLDLAKQLQDKANVSKVRKGVSGG